MNVFHSLVVHTLPLMPKALVGHLSRHYIAGPSLDDAVRAAREVIDEGCCVTMDVLGESVTRAEETRTFARQYHEVLQRIADEKLDANVSVKPTQMGLALDPALVRENDTSIVGRAAELGNFVRIDMEDTPWTTATLDLHDELVARWPGHVGVVIQAYLRRTMSDTRERLIPGKANLRLCKGIYVEPESLAFKTRQDIRDSYLAILRELLSAGNYVGIATHDEWLVDGALEIVRELNLPREAFEFQMLLGVLPDLRRRIVARGHKLRVYVPFGEAWFAYSTRRLKENPSLVNTFIVDMFRKH